MKKLTTDEFVAKCMSKHGDRYDYSSLAYVDSKTKVKIVCREHGEFKQWPSDHRRGFGCPHCSNKAKHTTESFIVEAEKRHGTTYRYTKVNYINLDTSISITCTDHGDFWTTPRLHIHHQNGGVGCPRCNFSKGEVAVEKALKELGVEFTAQKIFKGCLGRFDFYIPIHNLCIEYDGAQHFHHRHIRQHFSEDQKKVEFEKIQARDSRKNTFCKDKKIKLLRISYLQKNNIKKIIYGFLRNSA